MLLYCLSLNLKSFAFMCSFFAILKVSFVCLIDLLVFFFVCLSFISEPFFLCYSSFGF